MLHNNLLCTGSNIYAYIIILQIQFFHKFIYLIIVIQQTTRKIFIFFGGGVDNVFIFPPLILGTESLSGFSARIRSQGSLCLFGNLKIVFQAFVDPGSELAGSFVGLKGA